MKSIRLAAMSLAVAMSGAMAQDAPYVTPETPLGTGRHPAVMLAEPTLPTHTVYRPKDVATLGGEK
ncbi:MAG: alpha/beta hydrolase, partial [Rubrivivax sp.]